jgi:hypothetical protein
MPDPIVAQPAGVATPPAQPAVPPVTPSPVSKPGVTPPPAAPKAGEPAVPGAVPPTLVPITALHEEREKRQSLQAEVDALKKIAGQNVLFDINGNPVQQTPQAAPPQNEFAKELDRLWETDPRKAVQTELMAALNWYDQITANLDYQESTLSSKYPDFNDYRTEVRKYVRALPPDQRTREGIVELAYYAVRGQKVDGIIARTKAEMEAEMLRKYQSGELAAGLPIGGVSVPPAVPGAINLTPDQKNACVALGISETDYIKYMKG